MPPPRKYDYQQIADLYKSLQSTILVAEKLGCRQSQVSRALAALGVPTRGRGHALRRKQTSLPDNLIAELYQQGYPTTTIAVMLGLKGRKSSERVRKRLLRLGILRRSNSHYQSGSKNKFYKNGLHHQYKELAVHYYRRQSYEIAAICLGQPLPQRWVIHHIDENPRNNNPENLMLFDSQPNHVRYHVTLLGRLRKGLEVDPIQWALENGAVRLQRPASLNGWKPDTDPPRPSKKHQKTKNYRKESQPENPATQQPERR